jgi:hypothetical protein
MSKGTPRAGRLLLAIALTAACASAGCRLLSADFSQERLRPAPAPPGRLYEVDEVGFPETCQAQPRQPPALAATAPSLNGLRTPPPEPLTVRS